jgi:ribosomal protein S15P/S13E
MLEKRRSLLKFMKRKNFDGYKAMLQTLGLKDRY